MPASRTKKNPLTHQGNKSKTVKSSGSDVSSENKSSRKLSKQGDYIFSLDIGTRTVIAIVGKMVDDNYTIVDSVVVEHTKRAMKDGQIEDIDEVAKVVKNAKNLLEQKTGIKFTRVCIAAAGRALKTKQVKIDIDIDGKDSITEEMVKSFELEAISEAQARLNIEQKDKNINFFCVGHSIVNLYLDDYPINSFVGHKGKVATVDMIAAFLPSIVVESLYSVMDKNKLEVTSLTLEPIAAMNVIIPPEIRLINVALVDIGAGTSDIAISKSGSIIAYAMATTAGDEITEEIIKAFLVDFNTAEQMKLNAYMENIEYTDILGFEHTVTNGDFFKAIYPAVETLADTIGNSIIAANGGASPSAVFLVGGGSQVSELTSMVAKKLQIPDSRVAIGKIKSIKGMDLADSGLTGPEYVTPLGIGLTSVKEKGYDFSTIQLNGKRVRIFNSNKVTVLDLLTMAGYKSANVIGRTGRGLTYTINGEEKIIKGEPSTPAVITVNDDMANINTPVKQGDTVVIIPAKNGNSVNLKASDILERNSVGSININGISYPFGAILSVNNSPVSNDYEIKNFDNLKITKISTLKQILDELEISEDHYDCYVGKRKIHSDYLLVNGDNITIEEKQGRVTAVTEVTPPIKETIRQAILEPKNEDTIKPVSEPVPQPVKAEEPVVFKKPEPHGITIYLNGKPIVLEKHKDMSPNIFLELMAIADIDTSKPQGKDVELTLNGKDANFMDVLNDGDSTVIRWIN